MGISVGILFVGIPLISRLIYYKKQTDHENKSRESREKGEQVRCAPPAITPYCTRIMTHM